MDKKRRDETLLAVEHDFMGGSIRTERKLTDFKFPRVRFLLEADTVSDRWSVSEIIVMWLTDAKESLHGTISSGFVIFLYSYM